MVLVTSSVKVNEEIPFTQLLSKTSICSEMHEGQSNIGSFLSGHLKLRATLDI